MTRGELEYYCEHFYGYGSWESDYYYIGMEEGGGSHQALVDAKLEQYYQQGHVVGNDFFNREGLLDNYGFQIFMMPAPLRIIEGRGRPLSFFRTSTPATLQSTWYHFIGMHLVLTGQNHAPYAEDQSAIRKYQAQEWGSHSTLNPHAVVELFPLPSPFTSTWKYGDWTSEFGELSLPNRTIYYALLAADRVQHIAKQIAANRPKLVVFYGNHSTYYNAIISTVNPILQMVPTPIPTLNHRGSASIGVHHWSPSQNTVFVICSHPSTRGITNAFFESLTNQLNLIVV